ncbi:DUF637 domain-containing protein [Thiopseudomonas denitrificans]|uniref:DUF637 domain-containing protein n=1 Tax=Thiopseudomonas denitrificans TaxID=1501432 RepID=UPI0019814809|nr:DUF637 domain-containing protein [Thiopseudomonas denitrificans]
MSNNTGLIQSQLQAQGEIAMRAAERIQIDIKEVNQQSVNQTIDAMVQADPQLAWLKDMQQRGDVDWRQVKELHDSFSYSSSNSGKVAAEGGLSTWGGVGQFAANQALQNVTSATLNKALGQDGDFGDALTSTLANTFAAAGFNWVGDISQTLDLKESGLAKIGLP